MSHQRPSREPQRIAKLLARAGVASRREIERMIEERRIAIDGQPVEKPATLLTSLHGVTVDGKPVKAPAPARLFRFHKPTGVLTAASDPKGRRTIYDRLPEGLPRLMPVGRLDMNTEGLLLLTTDGELKRQLELPSSGIERTYRARVFGEVSQDQLEELIHGVEIDGIRYGAIDANLERRTGRNGWVEMKLTEGKNREVRRVLEHLGLQVSRLIRVSYGPFHLDGLAPGAVDEIRQHDLVAFRKALSGGAKGLSAIPGEAQPAPRPPRARPPAPRWSAAPEERPAGPKRADARPQGRSPAPQWADGPRERSAAPKRADGPQGRPSAPKRTDARPQSRSSAPQWADGPRERSSAPKRGDGPMGRASAPKRGEGPQGRPSAPKRADRPQGPAGRTGPRGEAAGKTGPAPTGRPGGHGRPARPGSPPRGGRR